MAQILNINMNSEIIRNLVTGYIKDSHHDFFKTNEVFKGIWMSTRSHVGGGVGADKSDSKRRRTEGGQDGGSSMESYTVEPTFFENVIISQKALNYFSFYLQYVNIFLIQKFYFFLFLLSQVTQHVLN